jgi:PAS domain-containing protein
MISTADIENLVPDFLMESGHFYLVITDVEGRILKHNHNFEKLSSNPTNKEFWKYLSINSAEEFCYSLELMLGAPKITRHLLLEHPNATEANFSQIWWEFSVITTPDMDISAVIGIGVGMQFLEQEMPWNNLVDVLGFGKITLNSNLEITAWDERIDEWFSPTPYQWLNKSLHSTSPFKGLEELEYRLEANSKELSPVCFLIQTNEGKFSTFATLLTPCGDGFHLFLVPKEAQASSNPTNKKVIGQDVLESFPDAVFVLDNTGKLIQQNERAKAVGRAWKGRAYSEGYALTFPNQSNRFTKLVNALQEAKLGEANELEVKLLNPDKEFSTWSAIVIPSFSENGLLETIWVHVKDQTAMKKKLNELKLENDRLRDMALQPSHVLRGPLSSILGILDLIDKKQLDPENQKLFDYLKPLATEIDQSIRQHAKKMSAFD